MQISSRAISTVLTGAFSVLFISACSTPQITETSAPKTEKEHIVQLQQVMRDLNQELQSHEHQNPLEYEDIQRRNALRLARKIETSAVKMNQAAAHYPKIINDPSALKQYHAYIEAFKQQGQVIQRMAESYQLEQLPSATQKLNQICISCHTQFKNNQ